MTRSNLSILDVTTDGADTLVVARANSTVDRYFDPLLAAKILNEVRGLVLQSCFSRPTTRPGHGAKSGSPRTPRRWAFAQEIYSNCGRGTEAGHFLEHLALEMALDEGASRRQSVSAETSWDWREEPDVFRIRFFGVAPDVVTRALSRSAEVLARHGYALELGPATAAGGGDA